MSKLRVGGGGNISDQAGGGGSWGLLKETIGNGGRAFQGHVKTWLNGISQEYTRMTPAKTPSNSRYIA